MQENKINPRFPLEEVVQNDSVKPGPFKDYIHLVEYHITREEAIKSAQIIVYSQVLVKNKIMWLVIIVNQFLAEMQRRRYGIGMETASESLILNQIQIQNIVPNQIQMQQIVVLNSIF